MLFPISKALFYEITTMGYTPNLEKYIPIPWQPPSLSLLIHRTPRCIMEPFPTALPLYSHPELELHLYLSPHPIWWSLLREERARSRVLLEKEPIPKLPTLLLWKATASPSSAHTTLKGLGFNNRQHNMPWNKRDPITHQPTTRKSDCHGSVLWERKMQTSLT